MVMAEHDELQSRVAERNRRQRAHARELGQRTRLRHRLKQIAAQRKLLLSRERIRRQVAESRRKGQAARDKAAKGAERAAKSAAQARQRAADSARR